jgi:hypothetical protein
MSEHIKHFFVTKLGSWFGENRYKFVSISSNGYTYYKKL